MRTQVKQLEENQKRRATRAQRDVLDRSLVDLLSLYRDVLVVQLGAEVELVNAELAEEVERLARVVVARTSRSGGWTPSASRASGSPPTSPRCSRSRP